MAEPKAPVVLRRYHVPSVDGLEGWGTFVIGSDGFMAAVTDYGNYAYRWGSTGAEFRRWLVRDGRNAPRIERSTDPHIEDRCMKCHRGLGVGATACPYCDGGFR